VEVRTHNNRCEFAPLRGAGTRCRSAAQVERYSAQHKGPRQMPLSEFERARIETLFGDYCRRRVPPHVRSMLRIEDKIRDAEVDLFACRPRHDDRSIWTKMLWPGSRKTKGITPGVCTAQIETVNGISSNRMPRTKTSRHCWPRSGVTPRESFGVDVPDNTSFVPTPGTARHVSCS